jgi:hypothetical protein
MPSHIFVQLGMWQDVRTSNTAAYASALSVVKRLHVPEGREDFHTLSWLQYANLMLGNFDEAAQNLADAHAALQRNSGNNGIRQGYLNMWARQILETQQWADLPLNPEGLKPSAPWLFIVGFSAAHKQNFDLAKQASHALGEMYEAAKKDESLYSATPLLIMQKEVDAEIRNAARPSRHCLSTRQTSLHFRAHPARPLRPTRTHQARTRVLRRNPRSHRPKIVSRISLPTGTHPHAQPHTLRRRPQSNRSHLRLRLQHLKTRPRSPTRISRPLKSNDQLQKESLKKNPSQKPPKRHQTNPPLSVKSMSICVKSSAKNLHKSTSQTIS